MPKAQAPFLGLISDTHGLMRPEALAALEGAEHIVHAGDVGGEDVLEPLQAIAPVTVVRGNVDRDPWGMALPLTAEVEWRGVFVHTLHIIDDLDLDPAAAGFGVVVFGHSHQPGIDRRGNVLFVNPGSAGPRRFRLPITIAHLTVTDGTPTAEIIPL